MVQPMLIIKANGSKFFNWNVDANVGFRSVNKGEDVALVQLGYFFLAKNSKISSADVEIFSQITPGEPYAGGTDEPLTKAIRHHQKLRGGTQDGHISVVKTESGAYRDPGGLHSYQLVALMNNVFDGTPDDFPRIDLLGELCPEVLRNAVIRECAPPPPPP